MELPEDTDEKVMLALRSLAGKESLFSDIKEALGFNSNKVEQVKGLSDGSLVRSFSLGANTVSRLTSKALGFNDGVISSLINRAKSVEVHKVQLSGKLASDLTANGDLKDLLHDQKVLSDLLSVVMKYQGDVEGYGKKVETLLSEAKRAKNSGDLSEIATKVDNVDFPVLKLGKKTEDSYESDTLPGGKVIGCTFKEPVRYTLNGTAEGGPAVEYEISKTDLTTYLTQMRWVNTQQKSLSEMINRYSKSLESWGRMVKDVQTHLDKTEGLSNSVVNQLYSLMSLHQSQIEFYTTFLPRLIAYVNHYVSQGNELAETILK